MTTKEPMRRTSYGANSPVVGVRGERTRALLVNTALPLFEQQGFHATSIEEIARAAKVSRATFYQYFESKEALFAELLEECGAALLRVIRRLGVLGPNGEGFDNLHWWLGEWAWVYDKYAPMFVEWANIDTPQSGIRSMVTRFVASYDSRIAERLDASGLVGLETRDAAVALTAVVHRFNYLRHRGITLGRSDTDLLDNLSVIMQLLLFPKTPTSVFQDVLSRQSEPHPVVRQSWPPPTFDPVAPSGRGVRIAGLGPRPAATVQKMLDAGAACLAERGYYETSVDDIVATAELARGTFYKYFDEKLDLLVELSQECARQTLVLSAQLGNVSPGPARHQELRVWLAAFVALHDRNRGVFRCWIEGTPHHPEINVHRRQVGQHLRRSFEDIFRRVDRSYLLDNGAASIVLMAILERLPQAFREETPDLRADTLVDLLALTIERGLLTGGRPPAVSDDTRVAL
jgi:AcrR family transcriptional regulator